MALGDLIGISLNQGVRAYDNGDGTATLQVQTTAGVPTTTVITKYDVTTAFAVPAPGAALGDVVQSIATYNTTTGALISTIWTNVTSGAVYASAPSSSDLTAIASADPYGTQFFSYVATSATGGTVAAGDVVNLSVSTDLVNGTVIESWYNVTQGTVLTGAGIPAFTSLSAETTTSYSTVVTQYTATATTAGFTTGDVLQNVQTLDPTTQAIITDAWYDLTTQLAVVTAPTAGQIVPGQPTTVEVIATALFTAVVANAGQYAIGDVLQKVTTINPVTLAVVAQQYNNLTQNTFGVTIASQTDIVPDSIQNSNTYSTVVSEYTAVAASAGQYSIGDIIQQVHAIDTTTSPATVANTSYNNLTTTVNGITIAAVSDLVPGTAQAVSTDVVTTALFTTVAASAGQYAIGDVLQQVNTLNPVTQAIVKSQYNNLTVGSYDIVLAAQGDIVPGSPAGTQYSTIYDSYTVVNAVTGGLPGEVLQRVQTLDTSVSPSTVTSTVWTNISTGAAVTPAPAFTDLTPGFNQSYLNNVQIFTANTAFAGQYAIGDIIEQVVAFDPSINPPLIVSTSYNNLTSAVNNITLNAYSDLTFGTTAADTFNAVVSVQYLAVNSVAPSITLGDILQQTLVYDISVNPPTIFSTAWFNLTTDLDVTTAPAAADVTPYFGGFLTNTQLRAAPVVVSTAQLPTVLGQTIMLDSTSVAIASDQSPIPVTAAQLPAALGQELMADSVAVVIASDQSSIPVTAVQLPVALGQTVAADSLAVTLASDAVVPVTDTTTFNYTVTTAFTGAALGDIVSRYTILDSTAVPPTVISETWYNVTQGTTLAAAPSYGDISTGGGNVTPVLPQVDVINYTVSAPGTVPTGCYQISFANAGSGNATIAGQILPPGSAISYNAASGGSIGPVNYDATGTTLLIATLN